MEKLLVVGLGNPGEEYIHTRHNLGIRAVQHWIGQTAWHNERDFKARIAVSSSYVALFPLTYMNDSGVAVAQYMAFSKILLSDLVVIHDEVELPLGTVEWKDSGSAKGHNGVRSIISALGTDQFKRLRLGIGRPQNETALDRYVLEKFEASEEEHVIQMILKTGEELQKLVGVST